MRTRMGTVIVLSVVAAGVLPASSAVATILNRMGAVVPQSSASSVERDVTEDLWKMFAFDEACVKLTSSLLIDDGIELKVDTEVQSHLIHADVPIEEHKGPFDMHGYVELSDGVIGTITTAQGLSDTDALFGTGMAYPTGDGDRGPDLGVTIDDLGGLNPLLKVILTVSPQPSQNDDLAQLRILTECVFTP